MAIMNKQQFANAVSQIKKTRGTIEASIQEALISAAFYAARDGNAEPFNQILDAVGNGVRKKGITMWAELYAPVRVKNERFVLNKKMAAEMAVSSEEDFASFEEEMRNGPKWYEIVGQERVKSVFDPNNYLKSVIGKLEKEGFAEIAEQIRAVKGKYMLDLIDRIEAIDVEH